MLCRWTRREISRISSKRRALHRGSRVDTRRDAVALIRVANRTEIRRLAFHYDSIRQRNPFHRTAGVGHPCKGELRGAASPHLLPRVGLLGLLLSRRRIGNEIQKCFAYNRTGNIAACDKIDKRAFKWRARVWYESIHFQARAETTTCADHSSALKKHPVAAKSPRYRERERSAPN